MSDSIEPTGMTITVKDGGYVIVDFEGNIPPILLSAKSAERVGAQIVSASNQAEKKHHES